VLGSGRESRRSGGSPRGAMRLIVRGARWRCWA
jgi:hypothetical protein